MTDITVEEMDTTVADFYAAASEQQRSSIGDLPLEADLADIFRASKRRKKGVRPAAEFLAETRKALIDKVTHWTGVRRPLVKSLVESIETRVRDMGLASDRKCETEHLAEITAYTTTLAMNYISRGKFVQS